MSRMVIFLSSALESAVHIAFAWSRDTLVSVVDAVSARFTVLVLMCAFCASLVCVQFSSFNKSASFIVSLFPGSCVTGHSLIINHSIDTLSSFDSWATHWPAIG